MAVECLWGQSFPNSISSQNSNSTSSVVHDSTYVLRTFLRVAGRVNEKTAKDYESVGTNVVQFGCIGRDK